MAKPVWFSVAAKAAALRDCGQTTGSIENWPKPIPMRASILLLIVGLFAGCATRYANLPTPNAATLIGNEGFQGGAMLIDVKEIDGVATPYFASRYYVAPGWHHLSIYVDNRWDEEVGVPFEPNGSYRMNVLMYNDNFHGHYPYAFQLIDAVSGKLRVQVNMSYVPPPVVP
jgi:hypothetical protein